MKILFTILFLLLSACDSKVYNYELVGYERACKDKGGIANINNLSSRAICADGGVVNWRRKIR